MKKLLALVFLLFLFFGCEMPKELNKSQETIQGGEALPSGEFINGLPEFDNLEGKDWCDELEAYGYPNTIINSQQGTYVNVGKANITLRDGNRNNINFTQSNGYYIGVTHIDKWWHQIGEGNGTWITKSRGFDITNDLYNYAKKNLGIDMQAGEYYRITLATSGYRDDGSWFYRSNSQALYIEEPKMTMFSQNSPNYQYNRTSNIHSVDLDLPINLYVKWGSSDKYFQDIAECDANGNIKTSDWSTSDSAFHIWGIKSGSEAEELNNGTFNLTDVTNWADYDLKIGSYYKITICEDKNATDTTSMIIKPVAGNGGMRYINHDAYIENETLYMEMEGENIESIETKVYARWIKLNSLWRFVEGYGRYDIINRPELPILEKTYSNIGDIDKVFAYTENLYPWLEKYLTVKAIDDDKYWPREIVIKHILHGYDGKEVELENRYSCIENFKDFTIDSIFPQGSLPVVAYKDPNSCNDYTGSSSPDTQYSYSTKDEAETVILAKITENPSIYGWELTQRLIGPIKDGKPGEYWFQIYPEIDGELQVSLQGSNEVDIKFSILDENGAPMTIKGSDTKTTDLKVKEDFTVVTVSDKESYFIVAKNSSIGSDLIQVSIINCENGSLKSIQEGC